MCQRGAAPSMLGAPVGGYAQSTRDRSQHATDARPGASFHSAGGWRGEPERRLGPGRSPVNQASTAVLSRWENDFTPNTKPAATAEPFRDVPRSERLQEGLMLHSL